MVNKYIPNKGDIVWINFNPQTGHEQAGTRPALVLSPKSYNQKTSLMLAVPITSKAKGYPFEVTIKSTKIHGVALSDHVKCLDWQARKVAFADKANASTINKAIQKIHLILN